MSTYFFLYQTTNLINNKIYIGVHQTDDLNDGYMGSGTHLTRAMSKHGKENFKTEILEFFTCSEDMYSREREVVNEDFVARTDTYNIKLGGYGGFDHLNSGISAEQHSNRSLSGAMKLNEKLSTDQEFKKSFSIAVSIGMMRAKQCGLLFFNPQTLPNAKEIHKQAVEAAQSPEAKQKRINTFSSIAHQQGEKNSQFGTCWITHPDHGTKKIKKDDLDLYTNDGWVRGRKL